MAMTETREFNSPTHKSDPEPILISSRRLPSRDSLRERRLRQISGTIDGYVIELGLIGAIAISGHIVYNDIPIVIESFRQANQIEVLTHGIRAAGAALTGGASLAGVIWVNDWSITNGAY